jgi:hypothetical protein
MFIPNIPTSHASFAALHSTPARGSQWTAQRQNRAWGSGIRERIKRPEHRSHPVQQRPSRVTCPTSWRRTGSTALLASSTGGPPAHCAHSSGGAPWGAPFSGA